MRTLEVVLLVMAAAYWGWTCAGAQETQVCTHVYGAHSECAR